MPTKISLLIGTRRLKIAVVFPSGHIFDTPCVPSFLRALAGKVAHIDVYAVRNSSTPDGELDFDGITLIEFPKQYHRDREPVVSIMIGFIFWLYRRLRAGNYDFVIACGIRGLFVVGFLSCFRNIRFSYNSLEIYPRCTVRSVSGIIFKKLECYFNSRARFSIIQDSMRAEILRIENNLSTSHPLLIFPNAPMCHGNTDTVTSHLARCTAGVPDGKWLILVSGSINADWAGIDDILSGIAELPNDTIVFLQSRSRFTGSLGCMAAELAASGRLIVSSEPLSSVQYDAFVAAADIGIAWYRSDNPNIKNVGLSSGKIAHYLSRGVPVIVNRIPLWESVIPEYECGVVVDDASEISAAVRQIIVQHGMYRSGASTAFESLFETEHRGSKIVQQMYEYLS